MREVTPGDLIFSFADTYIRAIGVAKSHCYECPKPVESGSVGMNWEQVGWKVDVEYRPLSSPIKPSDSMADLRTSIETDAAIPKTTREQNAGTFSDGRRRYPEFHREPVFLQAVQRGQDTSSRPRAVPCT